MDVVEHDDLVLFFFVGKHCPSIKLFPNILKQFHEHPGNSCRGSFEIRISHVQPQPVNHLFSVVYNKFRFHLEITFQSVDHLPQLLKILLLLAHMLGISYKVLNALHSKCGTMPGQTYSRAVFVPASLTRLWLTS